VRVGYAVCDPAVTDVLGRVVRTFNVGSLGLVAAEAALGDVDHVAKSAAQARRTIERIVAEVRGPGVRAYRSLANFVLIDTGRPSGPLYDALLRKGVIVRPMAAWGLPNHLRVSVGPDEQMDRVIGALNDVLA
jgi:histidinol-phosphate aminotransferase